MSTKNKNAGNQESKVILTEIAAIQESGITIIVEGKKDKASLNKLELSNIITLNKPLYEIVESINEKDVIILTDLDAEGRKLYHKLKSAFSKRGVNVDNNLRKLLFKAKVRNIEALYGMIQKWNSKKE